MQLLPLGHVSGYTFKYFISDGSFTKSHILTRLMQTNEANLYLPDDANYKYLVRDYLLLVRYILILI